MNFFLKIKLFLSLVMLVSCAAQVWSQPSNTDLEIKTLISRLDTTSLKPIISNQKKLASCAQELLDFYKKRNTIKHPSNIQKEGEVISEKDQKYADDALKHIFVGQPAYPSHFCGEDINWNSRPVPDNEWVWQLNRMYFWNAMGKVYKATGDERYAKEWCAQLVDWTKKNPRDQAHAYAWRSIEAGIRGHNWTSLFFRFIQSENFTQEVLIALLNSCYEHAEYLMTTYSSGSNWALMEAEGLAFIAFTFPEFKNSEKWKKEAIRRLSIEINNQVNSDGHQKELAMGYHLGSINWFYRTYELASLNDAENAFPKSYQNTIALMCEVPMKICLPDGTNAQFGDSWAGIPGQHSDRFMKWYELFKRDDFLFMATDGEKGEKPEKTAFALEESGIYSLRSGWDKNAICIVLKCGPDGGFHCQPDNGTFTLYAGGRTLMPDAGCYIYHGDPKERNWFRQTSVHQTLTLNGANIKYAPRLLKWKPGNDLDILAVENASYDNLTHHRMVFFVDKTYFVIVDEAIGKAVGDVDIHFQLAPGDAVFNAKDFSVHSQYAEGWNVLVQSIKQKGLELSEEEGKVSFEYTKQEARPAFRYRLKKTKENQITRFVTVVAPYQKEIPDIKFKVISGGKKAEETFQIQVKINGEKRVLNYNF